MSEQDDSSYSSARVALGELKCSLDAKDTASLAKASKALEKMQAYWEKSKESDPALDRYIHLFSSAPVGIVELDHGLRILSINSLADEMLQHNAEASSSQLISQRLLGKSFVSRIVVGVKSFFSWVNTGCKGELEVRFLNTVKKYSILLRGQIIGEGLSRTYLISMALNEKFTQLRDSLLRYQQLFDVMDDAVLLLDRSGIIKEVNCAMLLLTGYSRNELIGTQADLLLSSPNDRMFSLFEGLKNHQNKWQGRISLKRTGYLQASIIGIKGEGDKGIESIDVIFHDISKTMTEQDRVRYLEHLEHLANYDSLTGLSNRLHFNKLYAERIAEAQRQAMHLTLFFVDLDKFKGLNDIYGHQYGDKLLRKFAQRIKALVRNNDLVARLGGDEFAILIADEFPKTAIEAFAAKMINHLQKPYQLDNIQYQTTVSIGIASYPNDAMSDSALLNCADQAMYLAKRSGRNNYQFFHKDLQEKARQQRELEDCIDYAIHHHGLELYFQPLNNLLSGKIIGFEALARLKNQKNEIFYPDDFIPEAERTGLIVPLGKLILTQAFSHLRAWLKRDMKLPISINMSALQLKDESTLKHIRQLTQDFPECVPLVYLEITETFFIEQSQDIEHVIEEILALGLAITLDDFGTGYSSIYSLKKFSFKVIKIDRAFVQGITHGNEDDILILKAMLHMIQGLGLKAIAEGMETQEEVNFLIENGCTIGQGFLFSKPMPASSIVGYVNAQAFD